MTLFYSIKFIDFDTRFSGEVEFPLNTYQNIEPYVEAMISYCRNDLTKSLKKWGFSADEMESVEFYYLKGSEENVFFSWTK